MIDWALILAAAPVFGGILAALGALLLFIRKNDLKFIADKIHNLEIHMTTQDTEIRKKLYEAEFRRYEERIEAQIQAVEKSNTESVNKIELKIDRIIDILMKKD